ncbi:MAG: hypothetical protein PUJ51_03105 [Clostridiales bacterium]|nr:hypothetical protein [Clostridiales bacterium]
MLYIVFILVLAGFIALIVWGLDKYSTLGCISSIIGLIGTIIFGIVVVFSTIMVVDENVYSDALYEKYTARREALEWRLEQNYTDNDNNLGATELYKEIQEYNEDLASAKANRANPWLKIYAGEYVDRLEFIEMN